MKDLDGLIASFTSGQVSKDEAAAIAGNMIDRGDITEADLVKKTMPGSRALLELAKIPHDKKVLEQGGDFLQAAPEVLIDFLKEAGPTNSYLMLAIVTQPDLLDALSSLVSSVAQKGVMVGYKIGKEEKCQE